MKRVVEGYGNMIVNEFNKEKDMTERKREKEKKRKERKKETKIKYKRECKSLGV